MKFEHGNKRCVLGHDISYTLSPVIHKAIYAALGETGEYGVEDVSEEELQSTVERLLRDYDGFNVTKPYKEKVARMLGSCEPVNTVRSDGKCTSTDPEGFLSDYTDAFGAPSGKILVLGAGGAAKSVISSLAGRARVYVYNRTYEKAAQTESMGAVAVRSAAGKYDTVINCTSLGLCGEQAAPDELDFSEVQFAYDLIYSPPETPFLVKAAEAGAKTRNGLGMLIGQAIAAHEFWRGEKFDAKTRSKLYDAVKNALKTEE